MKFARIVFWTAAISGLLTITPLYFIFDLIGEKDPPIDIALQTAVKLGAQVALPKMPVPGVGAVAAIIDPQGNTCGLWQQEVSA